MADDVAEAARLAAMQREGLVKLGSGKLPEGFFEKERPEDPEGSLVEAVLEERETGRQKVRFWDTSSVIPLIVGKPRSDALRRLLEQDIGMVVWWATRVECVSAISRRVREGTLAYEGEASARELLNDLSESWTEAQSTARLRTLAE